MKAVVVAILAFAAVADAAKVTPMEKVIGLLKGLSEKVAAEGKEEAANYDKYACFCKEQADEKLYAIENSKALIKKQTAQIDKLDGEINKLNSEIGLLSKEILKQEGIIDSKTKKRNSEHDEYMKDANDYLGAIDACERAIAALKDSKGSLSADAKSSLALVQEKTASLRIKGAPKFQYQSNNIIELLEDLLDKTKVQKNELDQFEFDLKAVYDKEMVEANNALRFAEKDKEEASALSNSKTEEMNTLIEERTQEDTDLDSDEAFLKTLTGKCEDAAKLFDQRSTSRSEELTALAKATEELEKGGAADSYGAEGKLNGFVQKKAQSVSFLQTRSARRHIGSKLAAIQQAQVLISDAADRMKSQVLSSMALRIAFALCAVKVADGLADADRARGIQPEPERVLPRYCLPAGYGHAGRHEFGGVQVQLRAPLHRPWRRPGGQRRCPHHRRRQGVVLQVVHAALPAALAHHLQRARRRARDGPARQRKRRRCG